MCAMMTSRLSAPACWLLILVAADTLVQSAGQVDLGLEMDEMLLSEELELIPLLLQGDTITARRPEIMSLLNRVRRVIANVTERLKNISDIISNVTEVDCGKPCTTTLTTAIPRSTVSAGSEATETANSSTIESTGSSSTEGPTGTGGTDSTSASTSASTSGSTTASTTSPYPRPLDCVCQCVWNAEATVIERCTCLCGNDTIYTTNCSGLPSTSRREIRTLTFMEFSDGRQFRSLADLEWEFRERVTPPECRCNCNTTSHVEIACVCECGNATCGPFVHTRPTAEPPSTTSHTVPDTNCNCNFLYKNCKKGSSRWIYAVDCTCGPAEKYMCRIECGVDELYIKTQMMPSTDRLDEEEHLPGECSCLCRPFNVSNSDFTPVCDCMCVNGDCIAAVICDDGSEDGEGQEALQVADERPSRRELRRSDGVLSDSSLHVGNCQVQSNLRADSTSTCELTCLDDDLDIKFPSDCRCYCPVEAATATTSGDAISCIGRCQKNDAKCDNITCLLNRLDPLLERAETSCTCYQTLDAQTQNIKVQCNCTWFQCGMTCVPDAQVYTTTSSGVILSGPRCRTRSRPYNTTLTGCRCLCRNKLCPGPTCNAVDCTCMCPGMTCPTIQCLLYSYESGHFLKVWQGLIDVEIDSSSSSRRNDSTATVETRRTKATTSTTSLSPTHHSTSTTTTPVAVTSSAECECPLVSCTGETCECPALECPGSPVCPTLNHDREQFVVDEPGLPAENEENYGFENDDELGDRMVRINKLTDKVAATNYGEKQRKQRNDSRRPNNLLSMFILITSVLCYCNIIT